MHNPCQRAYREQRDVFRFFLPSSISGRRCSRPVGQSTRIEPCSPSLALLLPQYKSLTILERHQIAYHHFQSYFVGHQILIYRKFSSAAQPKAIVPITITYSIPRSLRMRWAAKQNIISHHIKVQMMIITASYRASDQAFAARESTS